MTVQGGSRPACAACRFQRRRCTPDCPLAQFFPANQPTVFENVHRLYGVGNITKILNQLDNDDQKQEAMKSIKYESYIRRIYRVHGCYGVIIHLRQQLEESIQELRCVLQLLNSYRKNNEIKDPLTVPLDSYPVNHITNDDTTGGGSRNWTMCYHDGLNENSNPFEVFKQVMEAQPYDWGDQQAKANFDLILIESQFEEFQLLEDDKQQPLMESKDPQALSLESPLKDTKHFKEAGD